jgi:CheY-like chemotaxis protein
MTPKALVIDDDPDILDAVSDILVSLGHDCDHADSVESARKCLDRNEYAYILLDLEIPARAGRNFPRIQNGENLLDEIIQRSGTQRKPTIIVMTAHGTDGPDLAVEVMKKGAVDYVTKPFKTVGRTLDKSIREALAGLGVEAPATREQVAVVTKTKPKAAPAPSTFSGGEMVFYADHVLLSGVTVCGGPRCEQARKVLDLLRQKLTDGTFRRIGSKKLAKEIGCDGGPNSMPGLIRGLRARITDELRTIKVECGRDDVIARCKKHGYHFTDWISVQDGDEETAPGNQGHDAPNAGQNVPNHSDPDVPTDPNPDDPNVPDQEAETRRQWILRELGKGRQLRAPDIEHELGCSLKTAKRVLKSLKDDDLIEFVGSRRMGSYRLKKGTKPR